MRRWGVPTPPNRLRIFSEWRQGCRIQGEWHHTVERIPAWKQALGGAVYALIGARLARLAGLGPYGLSLCADFRARYFDDHGLPSAALTADSPAVVRRSVQDALRNREITFIFVVDLYNEGGDISEVDTVLFLRPTESLTVLDFIGAQRREFRFATRFRALSTKPEGRLDHEIEKGFPPLPGGCVIQLERVAQQRVLANVPETVRLLRPRLVGSLRDIGRYLGRAPTIGTVAAEPGGSPRSATRPRIPPPSCSDPSRRPSPRDGRAADDPRRLYPG